MPGPTERTPAATPRNLFTSPRPGGGALVAPSILSASFTEMGRDVRRVLAAGGDLLHLDVMDGHFVPNLTMGPDMCRWLRRDVPEAFLDVHLMVTDPDRFVESFAKAGANHLTFHVEVRQGDAARRLVERIRGMGMTAGIAINPPTPIEPLLPLVGDVDLVLVMSVNPGFSGQSFIAPVLEKTRAVAGRLRPGQRLQMDGGVGPAQAGEVREAGCDVIVAASAIFGQDPSRWSEVIGRLRGV